MQEIKLKLEDENLEVVMGILENLKEGLILDIQSSSKSIKQTQYKPKSNKVIKEETSSQETQGKYLNPSAFKQKLKNRR